MVEEAVYELARTTFESADSRFDPDTVFVGSHGSLIGDRFACFIQI